MNKSVMYSGIGVTGQMKEAAGSVRITDGEYERLKKMLFGEPELFCREVRKRENYRKVFLHLYLRFAADAHEEYKKAGIEEGVYDATMSDIVIWADNCFHQFGETGIEEAEWLWRHVTLRLFRLGRLQYELIEPSETLILNRRQVKAGTRVLNLHIPQGGPLSEKACRESLRRAGGFFPDYSEITTHTWLLNPEMERLLGKECNIVRFQRLFDIYALDEESRQAEERVFGTVLEHAEDYPETTALQKALKRHLLGGNRFGSAYGKVKDCWMNQGGYEK